MVNVNRTTRLFFISVLLAVVLAGAAIASTLEPPAEVFKTHCANCHGASGDGKTAYSKRVPVPDLRRKIFQDRSDEEIYASIATGAGHVNYPHSFGSRGMDREKILGLVQLIRTFKNAK